MPQLDGSTFLSQGVWLFLCIGFLYCVVWRHLIPRYEELKVRRASHIKRLQEEAEDVLKKAHQLEEEFSKKLYVFEKKALEESEIYFQNAYQDLLEKDRMHHKMVKESLASMEKDLEETKKHILDKTSTLLIPLEKSFLNKIGKV